MSYGVDEGRVGGTRTRWITGLILLAVPAALFHRSLFGGEALFGRDMAPFFYPMKYYLVETVRSGQLPLWNPWILNGEPFFASLQPGLLYPGSLLLYLLPLPFSVNLLHALHYSIAGAGMYLLLRGWRHQWPAALFGALAFMAGGYLLSIGNFTNNLQTVALLPWAFWCWSRFLTSGNLRDGLLFTAACGIAFLGGEPQMLALGLGLLLLHGLLNIEGIEAVGRTRQLVSFAAAGALAAALVAVQLIPFVEYLGQSVRVLEFDYDFAARNSLAPAALVQLFVAPVLGGGPHDFSTRFLTTADVPWLLSVYPGALVLCLAGLGLAAPRSRRWAWFWGCVALFGVLLAMGRYLPLHRALYDLVPPFRLLRYPEKFYFLAAFAFAVLAAGGVSRWLSPGGSDTAESAEKNQTPRSVGVDRTALAIFGVGLLLFAGMATVSVLWSGLTATLCDAVLSAMRLCADPSGAQAAYTSRLLLVASLVGTALATAWLVSRLRISRVAAALILVLLSGIDLVAAGRHLNPTVTSDIYRTPPWAAGVLDLQSDGTAAPFDRGFRYRGTPLQAQMGSTVIVQGAEDLSNLFLWYEVLGPNLGQVFRHLTQDGLQGVELLGVAEMIDLTLGASSDEAVQFLRATSVRYYADATAAADTMPGLTLFARHPELPARIFEVSDPSPRAYLVSRFEVVGEPAAALRATMDPSFPLSESVVLDRRPQPAPVPEAGGRVARADFGLNRVAITAEADDASLLVLTDRHYPGWKATVNGRPAPIYRAAGYLRAVAVPAGRSEVVFRFVPKTVMAGGIVSACALLLVAGLLLLDRRSGATP